MFDVLLEAWAKLGIGGRIIIVIMGAMSLLGMLLVALWFGWEFGLFLDAIRFRK